MTRNDQGDGRARRRVRGRTRATAAAGAAAIRRADDGALLQRVLDTTQMLTAHVAQAQRALAAELCRVEERERRRLAKELHDQALQTLAAAKINLQILGQHLTGAEALQLHQRTLDLVSQAGDQLRALTAEISPLILYEGGLGAALTWLAERFGEQYGVPVCVKVRGSWPDLPVTTSVLLFHSARELLANAGRHAKANQVTVRFSAGRGQVTLSVADDGLGFDVSTLGKESQGGDGLGLLGIRERLRHVGGSLDIQSQPGQGTTLTLTTPL